MAKRVRAIGALLSFLLAGNAEAQSGELRVEIHEPSDGSVYSSLQPTVDVQGGASIFGGVKQLDLFLVIDTSKSLLDTDPKDYRAAGAVALVRNLPVKSDIQVGVVDIDGNAELVQPLTKDRNAVVGALRELDRHGTTDLADGIRAALAGFESGARPDSSRIMLLFTDGKSNEKKALQAMQEAQRAGVAIHTLLLGSDAKGTRILSAIAEGTGGSFVRVTDPARLPEAFLGLRTTGVERVTLSVNGGPPLATALLGGVFSAPLPLVPGENRIVARATSLAGITREAAVTVIVTDELAVRIDTPGDGTLYTESRSETEVTGFASLFANLPPETWANHPDHGVRQVLLRVDDSPPFATLLEAGRFSGRVMLHEGENRILATATSLDGRVADAAILVTVRPPGCAELEVQARQGGIPARSLSDRAVEIVLDASNSMWARIDGRPKIEIARTTLEDALGWMSPDLNLALRVYGHRHAREARNCQDSELLVSLEGGGRDAIRQAIGSVKPRGQTPLGYSLEQVTSDFGGFQGERAVVLVTDGIESCGGDPASAAAALQAGGRLPVHVIGFGLAGGDADAESLRAIAAASGGRYLPAANADELREALSVTVGTAFRVSRDGRTLAEGTLGSGQRFRLPAGDYQVSFDSQPAHELPLRLAAEEALTLVVERAGDGVARSDERSAAEYHACSEAEIAGPPSPPSPPPASSAL